MPYVADAAAAIRADMAPFQKDFAKGVNQAEGQTKTLGQKMQAALSPGKILAGIGLALGSREVINFLVDAGQAASDLGETISKTGQIFGEEVTPQLEEWAETADQAFGVSKRAALDAASTFATFGKSAGLAGQELVGFSTGLTELAADLASFYNTSPEDAIQAIGAALRGESEPIRRYGVLLDDATLRQRALKLGIIDTVKSALTPQQRVLAAQAEIFAQTSDAQGDFARTSDGLANTQRQLAAEFENLQAEIGEKVMPIMLELARFVNDTLLPAISELMELMDGNSESWEGFARIMDQVTLQQGKVQDVMRETNLEYMEARQVIKEWNEATGTSAEVLVELIRKYGSLEAALESTDAALLRNTEVHDENALRAEKASFRVERAYEDAGRAAGHLSDKTAEEMEAITKAAEEAHETAVDEISDMFDELIGLFSKDDFEDAVEDFHKMLNDPWPDTRRRAAIEAELASKGVRDGLRSDDSRVVSETIAYVNDLIEQYEAMEPGALAAGNLVNPALQDGLQANLQQTIDVAEDIAARTGESLRFEEFAENAGYDGLSSFNSGMSRQRTAATITAAGLAKAARDELYFNASAGGAASGWTFVNGLAGVLTSWDAATRLQNAAQLLKTRSLGGSLPTSGPFSKGPLETGARSIGDYWNKALADTVAGGLTHLRFAPAAQPLTGLGVATTVAQPAPSSTLDDKAPVNIYGDINLDLAEESVLDELRELADFGSRG